MSRLAELLKNRREELNKTVAEVSSDTKIRVQFIENIDNGEFKLLPSYLHAYGFVKKYAEYLGLPYDDIKDLFNEECPKDHIVVNENHDSIHNGTDDKKGATPIILAVILVVLCVAGWFGYSAFSSKNITVSAPIQEATPVLEDSASVESNNTEQPAETAPAENSDSPAVLGTAVAPNVSTSAGASTEAAPSTSAPAAIAPEAAPIEAAENKPAAQTEDKSEKYITLSFSGDCWVRFVSDNGKIDDFMANKNTVEELAFINSFTISIGNAAAISMKYGSQDFTNFGSEGKAVRNLRYVLKDGVLVMDNN